ncbi:STAS domain-containing protein [Actinomadura madurae]|uniref:STAS domain-containing protein n=1 Tax=Actinomadura madurae TaxID=1993 RepID=UPI0020D21CDA|nr:STAS domain-containing protein [Actinomadura madurae]MCQ0015431.1 STAS domain-containing protein [Actinomadura madurae]
MTWGRRRGTRWASPPAGRGDTTVMMLAGELDMAGDARLRARVAAALADRPRTLVLELSGLEFIDCTGLSIMIWARNRLDRDGATLRIRNARPMVARVLDFGGLTRNMAGPPAAGD